MEHARASVVSWQRRRPPSYSWVLPFLSFRLIHPDIPFFIMSGAKPKSAGFVVDGVHRSYLSFLLSNSHVDISVGNRDVQLIKQHGLSLLTLSYQQRKENFLRRSEDIKKLRVFIPQVECPTTTYITPLGQTQTTRFMEDYEKTRIKGDMLTTIVNKTSRKHVIRNSYMAKMADEKGMVIFFREGVHKG